MLKYQVWIKFSSGWEYYLVQNQIAVNNLMKQYHNTCVTLSNEDLIRKGE